jgi:16S rRNA (guanine966-N2)-methyltransferase
MRVISGLAKGHNLKVPKVRDLRPTQDSVRMAIFNILGDTAEGKKAADLYAGSGALGIEAISRGARECIFVDSNNGACKIIRENLNHTKLAGKGRVVCRDVEMFLEDLPEKDIDLVLLDPPYTIVKIKNVLDKIVPHLRSGAMVVYEHAKTTEAPKVEGLRLIDWRIYGETKVSFYTRLTGDNNALKPPSKLPAREKRIAKSN